MHCSASRFIAGEFVGLLAFPQARGFVWPVCELRASKALVRLAMIRVRAAPPCDPRQEHERAVPQLPPSSPLLPPFPLLFADVGQLPSDVGLAEQPHVQHPRLRPAQLDRSASAGSICRRSLVRSRVRRERTNQRALRRKAGAVPVVSISMATRFMRLIRTAEDVLPAL